MVSKPTQNNQLRGGHATRGLLGRWCLFQDWRAHHTHRGKAGRASCHLEREIVESEKRLGGSHCRNVENIHGLTGEKKKK